MNGIAISKFVGSFAVLKFLGNLYLSEQIFNRKRSLGAILWDGGFPGSEFG